MAPADAPAIRAALRQEFSVAPHEYLLIMVGSDFQRKGLDRTLRAMASLPDGLRDRTRLMVLGESDSRPFERLAKRLGLSRKVLFLGGRDDVLRFLLGADLLVHPAYTETAGIVLLEAIVAGLPVLTTANCGYAFHVDRARAGVNLPVPFSQDQLNRRLAHMLSAPEERARWSRNGIHYGLTEDLYSLPEAAAETISTLLTRRRPR
jgi:UDP-glucose:(heptosyl)LPS alpha-1,3-glucosyltransferase